LIEKYDFNCKYCGSEEKVKLDVCINCRNIKKQNKQIISKNKVYGFYGGKCIYCNCADSRFLTIDHILNNGSSHRKEIGQNIYFWLISNNMPKDNFQLLCYNCNYSKYFRSLNINTIIT
jgi:hypothetical protein